MKTSSILPALVAAFSLNASALTASSSPSGTPESDLIARLKKDYPVSTCVVSGEKLQKSVMGDPVDYLHQEEGKAPRLVRFCCKGCIKSFKKDTAKYLKMIDEIAKRAAAASVSALPADGQAVHGH